MPTMLEQAIIDANSLREAALKNAEFAVVEKYSEEVKEAVGRLLEQDDLAPEAALAGQDDGDTPDLESTLEQVPMAHLGDAEEDVVVVDLDDIIAATEDDEEEIELDRDEIAAEVGIDLEDSDPANRSDTIDLSESELVDLFTELLVVDVPEVALEQSLEELEQDEKEEDEKEESIRVDGMNNDDIEEYEKTMAKNEALVRHNSELKKLLNEVTHKLQNISLQNARLLYANRVLTDNSLNEQQKIKIVGMIGNAGSVEQAKTIFETLQKAVATTSRGPAQSLSEVVTKGSSVILSSRRTAQEDTSTEGSPTYNRWATLAGMTHK
jgi:hypothetical protein